MTLKKTLAQLDEAGLTWVTPSMWKTGSELRTDDGEIIARVNKRQRHWWSSPIFEVDASGSRWSFERKGTWSSRVEIRSLATNEEIATFHYNGFRTGGRLQYRDGRTFLWKQSGFWGVKWVWLGSDKESLLGFETSGMFKLNAAITLDPDQVEGKAPSLLLFLGWFLINMYHQDSSGAFVAAG